MCKAIFLGSFNPPHKGHLKCIQSVLESNLIKDLNIQKIHMIPCYHNPNKDQQIPYWERYQMTELLFTDLENKNLVHVDDIEDILRPIYTYDLLEYFHLNQDNFIKNDFWWIITYETIKELIDNKWFKSEYLLRNNKFIVLITNDFEKNEIIENVNNTNLKFIKINKIDYHSTDLRNKIKNKESIKNETNKDIEDYIKKMKLYK